MPKQIFIFLLLFLLFSCQRKNAITLDHQSINADTDQIFNKLVKVRRDFHENPELAKQETRTKAKIKQYLLDIGLEVKTNYYGNSVVGILKGRKEGKTIGWRADMDALPHDFLDEVDFKSKTNGVQHGCGHDVHMAVGLGIAEVLAMHKSEIRGTVYFIFQPEEETFLGAKNMIEMGLLDAINLDEIYALHVTALPVGKIMIKSKELFAYQKRIELTLKNQISKEEATDLYNAIRSDLTRTQSGREPWNIQNIVDPEIGLLNPNTHFSDYSFMDEKALIDSSEGKIQIRAYLYETDQTNLDRILPKIERIIKEGKYKDLYESVSFIQENPTVLNDDKLTEEALNSLLSIYGKELVSASYGQIPYFNDDFCYFQQKVAGVYFLLGGSNFDKGMIAMNHAPNFRVEEECIRVGVKSFSSLILERLNKD